MRNVTCYVLFEWPLSCRYTTSPILRYVTCFFSVLSEVGPVVDKVLAHVHLAFEGVFDPELLTDFFSDERIFHRHKRDGGLALLPKYLYDSGSRSLMIRNGAEIVQGLLVSSLKMIIDCSFRKYIPSLSFRTKSLYEGPKMAQ